MPYFNYCDGRKPKLLENAVIQDNTDELVRNLKRNMSILFSDSLENLHIDQNTCTHIAYIIDVVSKQNKPISIYLDSHEVFWFRDMLQNGELSLGDMSYPNYAPKHQFKFNSQKLTIFNPEKPLIITESKDTTIVIIHSHVSRLTGQEFPVEDIFKKVKEEYQGAVCIVDGAQMIGGKKIYSFKYTDAYIGISSKFINAELNLGFCLLNNSFENKYLNDKTTYPSVDLNPYTKELWSTNEILRDFNDIPYESYINDLRRYFVDSVNDHGLQDLIYKIDNQVPHIVTLHVGDKIFAKKIVSDLGNRNMFVSENTDYSIIEPRVPLIRFSISVHTKREEIDEFVRVLKDYNL